ncbi:MAG: HAD-IB family hydrolase [Acidimicrobiales bacterium]
MSVTLRLPGSVAEIEASPEGPEIGAFFDFDGTLIAGYSASHLHSARLRSRDVSLGELGRTLGFAVNAGLGRAGFEDLLKIGAEAWKGRAHDDLEEMGERLFQQKISDIIFPEARELVRAHLERGHSVVLSSSATEYQAEPVARYLGVGHVLCNRFGKHDGVLTGDVEQPVIWGPTKASVVQQHAADHGIDLARSYFYADGDEDTALMYLVGHPRPTNPGKKLERVAKARGWPTLRFTSRSSSSLGNRVKQLAGLAALAPVAAGGAAVGLARRDLHAGVNFSTSRWLSAVFAINGVKLRVVGREHLSAQRPAVFVFNHRNNVDVLIAASLVERDFAAVARKELANELFLRAAGKLAEVTFADRGEGPDALKPLEDMVSKGRSILVAAEGARVDTTTVGPFEAGAFRVAMGAAIPIVPIVIRNAELIAGPTAATMVPGVVDVAVLPPVTVEGWSDETFDEHVAEVRQLFLDTLAGWPEET